MDMEVEYRPRDPRDKSAGIGLIGCGGITKHHLQAYRAAGYRVLALCDVDVARAQQRRDEFYPDAEATDDFRRVLDRDDVTVVDIATHPPERPALIEAALRAGKHVLSQKPFVLDLDEGRRLVDLASDCGRQLAVNQNGRWAPHFSYAREAIRQGLLGEVNGVHLSVHWDHAWVAGTPFEDVHHLILYDYAIHWFDILGCLIDSPPRRVYATTARSPQQQVAPPLLAQAVVSYDQAQASLAFDANTPFGSQDRSFIAGSQGSISSVGPGNRVQELTITTEQGTHRPPLVGDWFPDGFHGTMGELLCAIEEQRPASISAAGNLDSLALCFAAVRSAETGSPVAPGEARRLSG